MKKWTCVFQQNVGQLMPYSISLPRHSGVSSGKDWICEEFEKHGSDMIFHSGRADFIKDK